MNSCFVWSFCLFWFLPPKLSLVTGQDYDLHPRMTISISYPAYLATYKTTKLSVVLVSTQTLEGAICMLDASSLNNTSPTVLLDRLVNPKEVVIEKEFFLNPGLVISHGDTKNFQKGDIIIANVADFNNILTYNVLPPGDFAYGIPTPVSEVELVVNRYKKEKGEVKEETVYFHGNVHDNHSWTPEIVKGSWHPDTLSNVVVIKAKDNAHSYVIFASLGGDQLVVIFTEKGRLYENKTRMVKMTEKNVLYLNTFDVNNDNIIDLIVTTEHNNGELIIYEVPMSRAFRDHTKYKKHLILTNFVDSARDCPSLVKPFYPASKYSGKPWILIGGRECTKASYLAPYWPLDKHNWDYREVVISKDLKTASGLDSVDLDLDGYNEVFLAITNENIIKVFSFKDAVAGSRISFELPLNLMIFCRVFGIFSTYF